MRVGLKSPVSPSKLAFVKKRLKEMENHRFLSMDSKGQLDVVGEPQDTWTPQELEAVMPDVRELATDPARGTKITRGGLEEAAVALSAENLEVFEDLRRETSGGAEFRDENGVAWDVKSPFSPPPGQGWDYYPEHHLRTVRKDFDQGDKVLFNLSRLRPEHTHQTIELLRQELSAEERDNLLILTDYPLG